MIGIYKITSPSNRVYIGQSIDIERRFKKYKNNCNTQTKLKRSFNKYGFDKHTFEIVEECDLSILNERERYWQEYYDVLNGGLNSRLTETKDKSGRLSQETKDKISKNRKGKRVGAIPWNTGIELSDEHKAKISKVTKGENNPMYGKNHSEETKAKISEANKGRKHTEEANAKKTGLSKIVLDTQTGVFYNSATEAAFYYDINESTLRGYLQGRRTNKTNLIWVGDISSSQALERNKIESNSI